MVRLDPPPLDQEGYSSFNQVEYQSSIGGIPLKHTGCFHDKKCFFMQMREIEIFAEEPKNTKYGYWMEKGLKICFSSVIRCTIREPGLLS